MVTVMSQPMTRTHFNPAADAFDTYRSYLLELRPYVQIAHHLPGRLRVQVRSGLAATRALGRFGATGTDVIARLLPGVRSVRLNPMAGSMVLEYDPKKLAVDLVDSFFRVDSPEQAAHVLDRLLGLNHANTGGRT